MAEGWDADSLRGEYDFTPERLRQDLRGRYAERFAPRENLAPGSPAAAEPSPDAAGVDQALPPGGIGEPTGPGA